MSDAAMFLLANAWMVPVIMYILTGRPKWMADA